MKANELMIGDWVMHNDAHKKVMVIWYKNNVSLDNPFVDWGSIYSDKFPIEEVLPIPLTPEILEKNGFKGDGYAIFTIDESSWLEYYYHEHRLRKWWSGVDEWQNHANVKDITFQCHCYYVHELQHALRLCGIEKEIEL